MSTSKTPGHIKLDERNHVEQQQFAGADAREMPCVRVHQKPAAVIGDCQAE